MQLDFNHIIPFPLKENLSKESEIWNKDYSLEAPEKVFINAPSGKGKSTFIHIIYGLRKDFEGQVFWNQKPAKEQGERQWAEWRKQELSIVFQDLRLFEDLTLIENIQIKQSLTHNVSMEIAEEWIKILGIEHKKHQKAATLSYGEKQRTAIIRALMQPFSWLLLDEPFSHLDNENIKKAVSLISNQLNERNAGLIMVDLEDNHRFDFDKKILL